VSKTGVRQKNAESIKKVKLTSLLKAAKLINYKIQGIGILPQIYTRLVVKDDINMTQLYHLMQILLKMER
jgi:hypothetical protein